MWRAGLVGICPHCNTRFFQGAAEDDVWLDGDLAILERCDAVLLVPGWENSEGTNVEIEHAHKQGVPVFDNLVDLQAGLKGCQPKQRQDVLKTLGRATDLDEFYVSVATSRSAAYRHTLSFEAWSLLHDLFRDLRQGARGKGMSLTDHIAPLELSEKILDEFADALFKEMRDRGVDLDSAFS